ncbi:MAG: ribonuclease H [Desulfobacteraceae bacterium]|nr:ribonuclease H [Desulfobacteraceae bacterium]
MTSDRNPVASDWQRMWFKENKVWVATDSNGRPISKDSKVLIKYQIKQDYEYWVNKKNVRPLDSPPPTSLHPKKSKHQKKKVRKGKKAAAGTPWNEAEYKDKICLFTDGASSGNPGPSGIGVLLRYGEHEKEISKYIGNATNNIAELNAIKVGLSSLKHTDIPVRLFTDSNYAYGLLGLNWKPKKNQELVGSIKKIMARFKDLQIIKVKGHSGHQGNERADYLATAAVKKQKS